MRIVSGMMICIAMCCLTAISADKQRELLKSYRGTEELPDDLYQTYSDLVSAIQTAEQGNIQNFCLPHSVTFTTEERPEKSREYGQDMNIPFLKQGFQPLIENLRKDSDDVYLLRTGSSTMFFVKTQKGEWKLYRYNDKPIE